MTLRLTLLVAALLAGLLPAAVPARAQGVDGRGELKIEQPAGGALVGEMLLLTFRAIVRGRIANRDVRQPSLADLDWQQLGRDAWSEVIDGNSRAYAFERTVAVFPRREGSVTIDPFVLVLTMLGDDNSRYEAEVVSTPLTFDVRSLGSGERLVHARSLSVTERWDKPPDRLASGETARRTVTIEAVGTVAERLPSPPSLRAPGVIAFAAPVRARHHADRQGTGRAGRLPLGRETELGRSRRDTGAHHRLVRHGEPGSGRRRSFRSSRSVSPLWPPGPQPSTRRRRRAHRSCRR